MIHTIDDLTIEGPIGLDSLETHRSALIRRLTAGGAVRVDCEGADAISLPLIQLLFAAHRTAVEQGCALTVACPDGGVLADALDAFGFQRSGDGGLRIEDGAWTGLTQP